MIIQYTYRFIPTGKAGKNTNNYFSIIPTLRHRLMYICCFLFQSKNFSFPVYFMCSSNSNRRLLISAAPMNFSGPISFCTEWNINIGSSPYLRKLSEGLFINLNLKTESKTHSHTFPKPESYYQFQIQYLAPIRSKDTITGSCIFI